MFSNSTKYCNNLLKQFETFMEIHTWRDDNVFEENDNAKNFNCKCTSKQSNIPLNWSLFV